MKDVVLAGILVLGIPLWGAVWLLGALWRMVTDVFVGGFNAAEEFLSRK